MSWPKSLSDLHNLVKERIKERRMIEREDTSKINFFCELQPWEKRTFLKDGKIEESITRYILGFDNFNWVVGVQNQKLMNNIRAPIYYKNIQDILCNLKHLVISEKFAIDRIIGMLVNKTEKKLRLMCDNPYKDIRSLGTWIDDNYKTSWNMWGTDKLYEILMKETSAEIGEATVFVEEELVER